MILYHLPLSTPCRFVRLLLAEYSIEPDLHEEKPWERREAFLELNPAGSVPVLVAEAGVPICGAWPIGEYLDETRGVMARERRLMPEYPLERAEVRRLADWFTTKLDADVVRTLVRERVHKLEMPTDQGGGAPNSAALRAARANVRQHMRYVNWLAGTRDWLGATGISAADMAAGAALSILDYMGEIDWSEVPQARDWYGRMKSRPSFRPLLADRVRVLMPVSHYADLDF